MSGMDDPDENGFFGLKCDHGCPYGPSDAILAEGPCDGDKFKNESLLRDHNNQNIPFTPTSSKPVVSSRSGLATSVTIVVYYVIAAAPTQKMIVIRKIYKRSAALSPAICRHTIRINLNTT